MECMKPQGLLERIFFEDECGNFPGAEFLDRLDKIASRKLSSFFLKFKLALVLTGELAKLLASWRKLRHDPSGKDLRFGAGASQPEVEQHRDGRNHQPTLHADNSWREGGHQYREVDPIVRTTEALR